MRQLLGFAGQNCSGSFGHREILDVPLDEVEILVTCALSVMKKKR